MPGKVREIGDCSAPTGSSRCRRAELDLPEPDEIGITFIDNADLKAREAADLSGLPALADDSGLCVEALAAGPASSRRAGPRPSRRPTGPGDARDASAPGARSREPRARTPSRDAHFVCALALVLANDGH